MRKYVRMRWLSRGSALCSAGWGAFLLCALLAGPVAAVTIDWVDIGDPGNAPDAASHCYADGCGAVDYAYRISRYEVTNVQYAEFLNAKAASDPLALYHANMGGSMHGGITRSGSPGSYTYAVKSGMESKPVNYVSFYDALRFINWLHNGQGDGDTETGAYTLLGGTATPSNGASITREPDARIFLPSENEWYKAAYYDAVSASYFLYATGTNALPTCGLPGSTPNTANCNEAVGTLTDVGAYTGSYSPYGTFDQTGNVWEWTEQDIDGTVRVIRGGSFTSEPSYLPASFPYSNGATRQSVNVGFRIASTVPEPGAALLLLSGALALAARRRTRPAPAAPRHPGSAS